MFNINNKIIIKVLKTYVLKFTDIRFSGQVAFGIIVVLISWSGAKTVQTNYNLQKQEQAVKQQNTLQNLENTNLALENEYYQSNQYLELSARLNFGLAAPGEKELIVPESVALSYVPAEQSAVPKVNANLSPAKQSNIELWVNFFLHRET